MKCGVDEAGLGPKVGSLFVVGVAVEGDLGDVRESKELFRRSLSTYARAEGIVLSVLRTLGLYSRSVADAWEKVFGRRNELYEGMEFPVFGGEEMGLPFRVKRLIAMEIPAHHLRRHRFLKDAKALVDISLKLNCSKVISGLAGGVKHYERFLAGWSRSVEAERIVYRRGEREILFVKGADKRFKEVALASIFAKYFREVHMMAVNRLAGFSGDIPVASGYPADPNTRHLVERLVKLNFTKLLR